MADYNYLSMLETVMKYGTRKTNRTGIDTLSVFGHPQFTHDMRDGFPLLTTKKVHWKSVVHELLWFISGSSNIKYLKDNGVSIWDEWADENGELGPVYGVQWRSWDAGVNADDIDQLQNMVDTIRRDPNNRRNIVTAWNPAEIKNMKLPPCHMFFQVNCEDQWLDLHMYQRSADIFLGVPFNIASYGLLLAMLAHITGRRPRNLITSYGDLHLYVNHLDQAYEQLNRKPRPLPTVSFNEDCREIDDFTFSDIVLEGYDPHPPIKAEVAV